MTKCYDLTQEKCPIIFLDMDGVIADFIQAALRVNFGEQWAEKYRAWPKGEYGPFKQLGTTANKFWRKIDAAGSDFWANLPAYPWTNALIEVCGELGKVCVLSSPSMHPDCVHGKLRWLHRVFGTKFRDYVFAPRQHKKLLAGPNRYLVEDSEDVAEEFVAAGGSGAVIIPRPWNNRIETVLDMVAINAKQDLEALLCKVR